LFNFLRNFKKTSAYIKKDENKTMFIDKSIEKNERELRKIMGNSPDLFIRELHLKIDNNQKRTAFIVGIDGLVDDLSVRQQIVEPLLSFTFDSNKSIIDVIKERLYVKDMEIENNLNKCVLQILKGSTLILIDGYLAGILLNEEKSAERAIEEPPTGIAVSGSREGFVEKNDTNIALLRQRIAHPSLKFKSYTIGDYSQTEVVVAFMDEIVNPQIVDRIEQKLKQIEVDDISSSGQIEQYLSDHPYSIFPTAGNSERPDQVAAMLMEGRVALLINGSPVILYYPSLFLESLHDFEDYSSKPFYASFTRLLRFTAFLLSIMLPAVYICAVNIHKGMIPSKLLLSLEESREGVPFPLVQETIMLLLLFEIVREAGIRMPRAIGQAVSIVGAIILGEVSVLAGLISSQTIIVVATASITTFIVTPVAEVVSLLRIFYIIPSAIFGFYGLMFCFLITITHMVNLKSMGTHYVGPIMPFYLRDWKDSLIRFPFRLLKDRPKSISNLRPVRYRGVPKIIKDEKDEI